MKRKGQREELQSVEGSQKAQLSKKLVTIQTDLELPPVRSAWYTRMSLHQRDRCQSGFYLMKTLVPRHVTGWRGRSCSCRRRSRKICQR